MILVVDTNVFVGACMGVSRHRGTSLNRLIDEMATLMLAEFDAETRFALRAERGRGQRERGLALLAKAAGHTPAK